MDKEQAITQFWKGFGLPAYDEQSVPEDAKMPYITFSVSTGALEDNISLSGSLWWYSNSWQDISRKANEISSFLTIGGKVIAIDGGYLWLKRGSPFANRMDDINTAVRRIVINLNAEFLTSN